jgi:hypothetical protein
MHPIQPVGSGLQPAGPPVAASSEDDNVPAVQGTSLTREPLDPAQWLLAGGVGVSGASGSGTGVSGTSNSGVGVVGSSQSQPGVQGQSASGWGVLGTSQSGGGGVWGDSTSGTGVQGSSNTGTGVLATSQSSVAVLASTAGDSDAIRASTGSRSHAAVSATNTADANPALGPFSQFAVWASSNNTAIYGQGNPAGYFDGDIYTQGYLYCQKDVHVAGDMLLVNSSGDIAEDFDLEDDPANAEPGTVLVIHQSGRLSACTEPYDSRVAGVVAGAGDLRPAIVLQRLEYRPGRSPLALVGKALCKVDAAFGGVTAGDLLTTSATPGHAMKVVDRTKAVGAVLGKALYPLDTGRGLVPILVSMR